MERRIGEIATNFGRAGSRSQSGIGRKAIANSGFAPTTTATVQYGSVVESDALRCLASVDRWPGSAICANGEMAVCE